MKIYTRTGDSGTTSLVGGTRVSKNSPRLNAYGTVDELNSHLGLLAADALTPDDVRSQITMIQNTLFNLGAQLATEPDSKYRPPHITPQHIADLESLIDTLTESLPQQKNFILPGGTTVAAQAHIARTVARRAERLILDITPAVDPEALRYINRLSDYLFTLARYLNHIHNHQDTPWVP